MRYIVQPYRALLRSALELCFSYLQVHMLRSPGLLSLLSYPLPLPFLILLLSPFSLLPLHHSSHESLRPFLQNNPHRGNLPAPRAGRPSHLWFMPLPGILLSYFLL